MKPLYDPMNVNRQKSMPYMKPKDRQKEFYSKMFKKTILSIIIVLLVICVKHMNTPITNKVTGVIKTSLNHEMNMKNTAKKVLRYAKEIPKVPDKVVNVFDHFSKSENSKYNFVVPMEGDIISNYGENTEPLLHTKTFQRGVDIQVKEKKEIVCIGDGEVVEVGEGDSLGKYIKVKHNTNIFSLYGNCSDVYAKKGQKIQKGESIAVIHKPKEENTYLHFELWVDGKVVDPTNYISFDKKML
ncbi:M23 family metallopeptidase [Inediibacterium massiliense]|uniref:M23 family metallopeptidase n=1 Tax=Inediibacterium massiliense TaxID=1658111 RepID=UPI0006B49F87|nr:M23 family metallopeptidase [Inediibacterium massiliense]